MMIEYSQKKYSHDFRKAKSIPKAQNLDPSVREKCLQNQPKCKYIMNFNISFSFISSLPQKKQNK